MAAIVSFFEDEPVKPGVGSSAQPVRVEQVPIARSTEFEMSFAEPGQAYVRHPLRPQRLLPLATYHADLVLEKTDDAIRMLTALGASEIEVAYSNQVSNEVKADVEALFGLIRFGGQKTSSERLNLIYTASGDGAPPRPLPALTWLDHPGWRGVIDGRLHGGLREFAFSLTYDHRSDVDGDLAAAVRKFGLRVGGQFRKAHRVDFSLRGTFPPLQGAPPA